MGYTMECTGCRLCLETITNNNFVEIKSGHESMLQVLIPVINWGNICREPKMCQKCSETLQVTYEFKILVLDNNKKIQKLKCDEMSKDTEEEKMCCLCCQEIICFENFKNSDKINLKKMVQQCFPQLNIQSSENLAGCEECLNSLKDLDSFINRCLDAEEYVKKYCSDMGITRRDRLNFDKCIERRNFPSTTTDNERETSDVSDNSVSKVTEAAVNKNDSNIESVQDIFDGTSLPQKEDTQQDINEITLQNKKSKFSRKFYCAKCDFEAKYKSALVSHMMRHQDPSKIKMFKCDICGHETKRKSDLRWHMICHKNPEEVKMYKCADCTYETKRKADLKQHVVVHVTRMFKCDFCLFETKNKIYLNNSHMLLHTDKSEIKIFKCESCSYEAKSKPLIKIHSRIHKEKLKCNWCNFETIYKNGLKDHLLLHKCRSELSMFKCNLCDYEGTTKRRLKVHMFKHNNPSQIVYECEKCTYKTKRKRYLIVHMKKHKDPSEFKRYECEICTFKTKIKASLKSHLYSHIQQASLKNKQDEIEKIRLLISNMNQI